MPVDAATQTDMHHSSGRLVWHVDPREQPWPEGFARQQLISKRQAHSAGANHHRVRFEFFYHPARYHYKDWLIRVELELL